MDNKELNHEDALRKLRLLISQVRDPELQLRFNDWINDSLHVLHVEYTTSSLEENRLTPEYIEHYTKRLLLNKLMDEASTVAKKHEETFYGAPPVKIRSISMTILGRKK